MLNNGPNYFNNKNVYRRWRWEGQCTYMAFKRTERTQIRSKVRWEDITAFNERWGISNAFKRALSECKYVLIHYECMQLRPNALQVEPRGNRPFPSFLVPLFQSESWVQNHSYENYFDLHENETACRTHFHMKGFALRLVLKQRHKRLGNGLFCLKLAYF